MSILWNKLSCNQLNNQVNIMQKLFCVSRKHVSKLYLYQGSKNSKQYLTSAGLSSQELGLKQETLLAENIYPTGYCLPKTSKLLMETSSKKLQEHRCMATNSILINLVPNCFIQLTPINNHIWKHTFYIVTFWVWSKGIQPNPHGKSLPLPS